MKLKIFFQNFKGFEHHYEFVENVMSKWLGKVERGNHPDEIKVVVRKTTEQSSPHFESEVIMTTGHHKKSFFAKKDSDNFFNAVRRSVKSLENALRRDSDKGKNRRREGRAGGLPAPFNFGSGTIPFDL